MNAGLWKAAAQVCGRCVSARPLARGGGAGRGAAPFLVLWIQRYRESMVTSRDPVNPQNTGVPS